MPKRLGNDVRMFVNTTGVTFVQLKAQGGLTISRSTDKIETSTKDTGAYKTNIPGQQDLTLKQEGKLDLPDPALEAIFAASKSRASIKIQIRDGDFSATKNQFECIMAVGNFNRGESLNDAASFDFELYASEAPTIDLLASF
jgi:TP901-1 family phage major tail protein